MILPRVAVEDQDRVLGRLKEPAVTNLGRLQGACRLLCGSLRPANRRRGPAHRVLGWRQGSRTCSSPGILRAGDGQPPSHSMSLRCHTVFPCPHCIRFGRSLEKQPRNSGCRGLAEPAPAQPRPAEPAPAEPGPRVQEPSRPGQPAPTPAGPGPAGQNERRQDQAQGGR